MFKSYTSPCSVLCYGNTNYTIFLAHSTFCLVSVVVVIVIFIVIVVNVENSRIFKTSACFPLTFFRKAPLLTTILPLSPSFLSSFISGLTITHIAFDNDIFRMSLMCLSLSDPIAAIVGLTVGGPRVLNQEKRWVLGFAKWRELIFLVNYWKKDIYIYIYKYEVVVELYSTRSMIKCSPFCIYNNDNVKKNDNIGD